MASASSPCRRLLPLSPPPSACDPSVSSASPLRPSSDLSSDPSPPHPSPPMSDDPPTNPSPPSPSSPKEPSPAADEASPPASPVPSAAPPEPSPRRPPRFPRACNTRPSFAAASSRTQLQQAPPPTPPERRSFARRENEGAQQCGRVITPLVQKPESSSQLPRWELRSMWELASVLNFLHVFREHINISAEFSAEELETALITPNSTLDEVHMPLLKAIPPITRMALGRATWVTVLCRKLKDWWHWVAEGDIPIVASHGTEVETYKNLSPGTRVLILKALCDIRVEQEDIRSHIEISLKRGIQLPVFRKERIGGDSYGISYWYEDDPIIGHRLYREIRCVEVKKEKVKGSSVVPLVSIQWEAAATNLEEFQEVSEKLFASKNRSEASLGKKLKIDFLPEIEKNHKKKERLYKKQHREALLLDSYLTADKLSAGRSLRDRKPVTYTFDDYDRSINEAIKITKKKQNSPENITKRAAFAKSEAHTNGKWNDPSQVDMMSYDAPSPRSNDYEETDVDNHTETLDRSNRRRKRPQRYSDKDYVEAVSDMDAEYDSDDDIVGEAVYDEEYLRSRKQRKILSGSEGDEEYHWEEENGEYKEEGEYSVSTSEDAKEKHNQYKKISTRSRRETKLRSVDELQTGLRRSRRSTRPRINYRQYEMSETDSDSYKLNKPNAHPDEEHSDASDDLELLTESRDSQDEHGGEEMPENKTAQVLAEPSNKEQQQSVEKTDNNHEQEEGAVQKRRFLDLNELAPVTGFDDSPSTRDGDVDNF